MESIETTFDQDSLLDLHDDGYKHKSNLKSSLSFKSRQRSDSSRFDDIDNENVINKRVHFRETIEVFSDGEETVSVPLNDDFTSFPSLRSPLRRLIGRRQRMHQRFIQASEDLYMVGDLYSNVPIIVLKKNVQPTSVDLIAPLATMDEMDLFDGFDDDDDGQSMSDWIDDVEDPNGYYYCGNDDLSAESDSEDVDEVMEMLLREKCLSDEEDFGMSSSNDHCGSDDGVSVDVVKKEVSSDDFFNEANIEEIESSSSTDSTADNDHFNGTTNFDECRDVTGNLMGIIPEEHFHPSLEPSDNISSPGFHQLLSRDGCNENADDSFQSGFINEIDILSSTSEISKKSHHVVPSLIQDKVVIDEVKFEDGPIRVARSKSTDFKIAFEAAAPRISCMMDSGFASLEMTDLESKLVSNDDRRSTSSDDRTRIGECDDSLEDKFSCSSDSNVSGSFVNFSPCDTDVKTFSSVEMQLSNSTDNNFSSNDFHLISSGSKKGNIPKNVSNNFPTSPVSCHRVELLPILTWIFCHPQ